MSLFAPIRGLCPPPAAAGEVAELPYDVMDRAEALAMAAGREVGVERLPGLDEQNLGDWERLIICLQDHVLWDTDFEMVDHLDAAPEAARRVKCRLGIAEDYFVAIPPDPSDADAERLLAELRTLTGDAR